MTYRLVAILGLVLFSRPLSAHPKTDVVVLANGDRITCEIKTLARGRLTVKTDAFGTVSIKWDHVARRRRPAAEPGRRPASRRQ